MKNNPEKLREFLMYHITSPKTSQSGMSNNKVLKTKTDQNPRINTYGGVIPIMDKTPNVITAQCARITNLDSEVCGGMIHTVDKVLMPPIGNFMDVMKLDPKHTEWVSLVQAAEMEEELNEHAGPLTMLAPTDGAFANMNEEEKSRIFQDKEIARQVVRHHMLRGTSFIYIYICVPLILYCWMSFMHGQTSHRRRLKLCMWPLPMGAGKIG